jgi:hypothetical protein
MSGFFEPMLIDISLMPPNAVSQPPFARDCEDTTNGGARVCGSAHDRQTPAPALAPAVQVASLFVEALISNDVPIQQCFS